jgi:hypothetical protein
VAQQQTTEASAIRRYDGKWEGRTSQKFKIVLEVKDGVIVHLSTEFKPLGYCPAGYGFGPARIDTPIVNDSFSAKYSPNAQFEFWEYDLTGTFESTNSVSGTFKGFIKKQSNSTPCYGEIKGTWTAEKVSN